MLYLLLMMAVVPCVTQDIRPPVIKWRSALVGDSDVVVDAKTPLVLQCQGDAPVTWRPPRVKHKKFIVKETFCANKAEAEHTGTYKCVYTNTSLTHLSSAVHVYVKDPAVPFVVSSSRFRLVCKEGDVIALPCLVTNPALAPIMLRLANGSAPPPDLNFTSDPHSGVTLLKLSHTHTGDYVCSVNSGGQEVTSRTFSVNVIKRLQAPPYVFLNQTEFVRIVGEELLISCTTHNPNFYYNITWKHNSSHAQIIEDNIKSSGSQLDIESIFKIPAVTHEDSGNITCVGTNEAGINSTATHLTVVDEAYVRVRVEEPWELQGGGAKLEVTEGGDVQVRLLIDAYPALNTHTWATPTHNTTPEERLYRQGPYRWEASLLLRRVNYQDQGQYTFTALNSKANASISFTLFMFKSPDVLVRQVNESVLSCLSEGYPAPAITWHLCPGIRTMCAKNTTDTEGQSGLRVESAEVERAEIGAVLVESQLLIGQTDRSVTLECVASNSEGQSRAVIAMEMPDKRFSTYLAMGSGVVAFLILLLLILLYKYKQKPRYEIRWKIVEASQGNNYTFIDPSQLPYNERWEFPRDKLRLGKTLGAGAFGKVVEATAYGLGKEDNVTRVAVKMLKASAHSDEKEALMSELKILSHLGQHKNIVNLLGACTHGGPVLVITEYCCHGDLLNFLRSKAESFLSVVLSLPPSEEASDYKNLLGGPKFIRSDSGISSTCSESYLDMRPIPQPAGSQAVVCGEESDSWPVDIDDLLRFSLQVAQGLDFLANQNCIHRDVAARNVLLAEGRVAKICDFGLARDIMNDSNYVVKGNARLPVKWMAPESIFECVYTVQSDVWSYGILLWEIFSLGKSPYPSIMVDSKFYKMIQCGYQMQRPDFSPPEMYSIMRMCWTLEPTERPTFSKICSMIQRLLGDQLEPDTTGTYQNTEQLKLEEAEESCDLVKFTEESCDLVRCTEESCDQSCDTEEEEEQPLMKTNNYQFC